MTQTETLKKFIWYNVNLWYAQYSEKPMYPIEVVAKTEEEAFTILDGYYGDRAFNKFKDECLFRQPDIVVAATEEEIADYNEEWV